MAAAGAQHRQPHLHDKVTAKAPHLRQDLETLRAPVCPRCGSPLGDFGQCTYCENLRAQELYGV